MGIRQTHTYVELELSAAAYQEISDKLVEAGYGHCFGVGHEHGEAIDMHGLAVTRETGSELTRCTITGFIIATYFKAEFAKPKSACSCEDPNTCQSCPER